MKQNPDQSPPQEEMNEGLESLEQLQTSQDQAELTKQQEDAELLKGFGFEALFDSSHTAFYDVKSGDVEMGVEQRTFSGERNKDVSRIPEVLRGMWKHEEIFDFIRTPSTDLTQLKQRQVLVGSLLEFDGLEKAIELKKQGYKVTGGVGRIFSLINVNEYSQESALFILRRGVDMNGALDAARNFVAEGIALIQEGRRAIDDLVVLLSESKSPFILAIAQEYRQLSEELQCLTEQFFLYGAYSEVYEASHQLAGISKDLMVKGGVFFEFSVLAKKDGYTPAEFNPSKPRGYERGWNFVRKKESQIQNDSPEEHEVTVYSGSNMSGKSFSGLKKEFFMQCLAQSFAYIPGEGGNFPVLQDSFHYIDRGVSTSSSSSLSAFGDDVRSGIRLTSNLGKRAFVCMDEGWSTTSAEDQYKLLRATAVLYLPSKGARVFLASHNERFIEAHREQPDLGIYHFKTGVAEGSGLPVYRYELMPGVGDSNSLLVARGLGVPEEIIDIARRYLNGEAVRVENIVTPNYREIKSYTEAQRKGLKKKNIDENSSIPIGKFDEKNGLLRTFSPDEDFSSGLRLLGLNNKGVERYPSFGGWSPSNVQSRYAFLNRLVLGGPVLTSQESLERRRTFEALAANDRFEKMAEVEEKLIFLIKFLPYLRHGDLLKFNLAINPFKDARFDMSDYSLNTVDFVLAYLQMNRKLMGKDFPLEEQYQRIIVAKARTEKFEQILDKRDLAEVVKLIKKERMEVIEDEELVELFKSLAKDDEPNPEKWGGVITRERILEYCKFISKNNWDKERDDNFRKLWSVVDGYCKWDLTDMIQTLQNGRDKFFEIAKEVEGGVDLVGDEKITRGAVAALICRFEKMLESEKEMDEAHCKRFALVVELREFYNKLWRIQSELGISEQEAGEAFEGRMTPDIAIDKLLSELEVCKKIDKVLLPLKAFDYDLSKVHEEIKLLAKYVMAKNKDADLNYYNRWDSDSTFAIIMEILSDKRDYLAEFLETLRSYDSIHTHQIANTIEGIFERYVTKGGVGYYLFDDALISRGAKGKEVELQRKQLRWKHRFCDNLVPACGKEQCEKISADLENGDATSYDELMYRFNVGAGSNQLSIFADIYRNTVAEFEEQVSALEKEKVSLMKKYPRVAYAVFERFDGPEKLFEMIDAIDEKAGCVSAESCAQAVSAFLDIRYANKDSKNGDERYGMYSKIKHPREGTYLDAFRAFVRDEIENSDEMVEIKTFCNELKGFLERAEALAHKRGVFESEEREHIRKTIRKGSLYYLRKKVEGEYEQTARSVIDFERDRSAQATLNNVLAGAMGLFTIGHTIKGYGMKPVSYNTNGKIHFPKTWNLFAPREGQVRNDVSFGNGTFARLLGSSNMSGKTFWEKGALAALSWATATGHGPSEEEGLTMPLMDRICYFARSIGRSDQSLSAFGEEMKRVVPWLKEAEAEKVVVSMVDEFGSSTSPKYAEALYYAVVTLMLSRGQYSAFASHSHPATDLLGQTHKGHLEVSHFGHHREVDSDGKVNIVFDRDLFPRREKSEAIDVAEMLGLDPEIIKLARLIK